MARKKTSENKIRVGNIREVSGEVNIAAGDIYKGYTAEQVSLLLAEITSKYQRKPFDGRCPYKGLEVFEEEDADLFFGRERLVEDLLGRVKESRTVFITGPSGSGKSSLVRAGLIHTLKQGAVKNLHSERWLYETMKPGREPLKELALALSRLKSPELAKYYQAHANEINILNECANSVLSGQKNQRFVLFVDQFEEVFTQINQEEERLAFLNMLAHAGTVENGRVLVLFAMRSDFVSNCAAYPALNELLSQQFRQIGAMQPEELVAAIALPAKEVGLPIENELIAQIINDMKGEPGALPLMQFALKDLFDSQQAKGGMIALTLEDYLQHGGIQKSLERHADASLAALKEGEQNLARSIFSGLIEIGRGTQDTRRTALFDELVPANTKAIDVEAVVQKLADARLIITDEQAGKDTVTISHEKLIDAWPWLKKLVNENRDVIALQNEIASDAKEWEDHQRDPSYLYTGARLANAREKLEANKIVLSGLAYEFVVAGQAQQRRSQRTRILGVAIPIGLVILAIIIVFSIVTTNSANRARENAAFADTQEAAASTSQAIAVTAQANEEEARRQTSIAQVNELAALALSNKDERPDLALLLSVEAYNRLANYQTLNSLLTALRAKPELLGYLAGNQPLNQISFSRDGKKIAARGYYGDFHLWDVETRRELIHQQLNSPPYGENSILFSPAEDFLVTGDENGVTIIDFSGEQPAVSSQLPFGPASSLAFRPDGKILAIGRRVENTVLLVDFAAKTLLATLYPEGEDTVPFGIPSNSGVKVALSSDGRYLAGSWSNSITIWDVTNPSEPVPGSSLTIENEIVTSLLFSPTENILVAGGQRGSITLWDVVTSQQVGQTLKATGTVYDLAISPDGNILASDGGGPDPQDKAILLWDIARQAQIKSLVGHSHAVLSVDFSPDGSILASGSFDGSIMLWQIRSDMSQSDLAILPLGRELSTPRESSSLGGIEDVVYRPDGKYYAVGSRTGWIKVWDGNKFEVLYSYTLATNDQVFSLAFDQESNLLAAGTLQGNIIVYDTASTNPHCRFQVPSEDSWVNALSFSPTDENILVSLDGRDVNLWNVNQCTLIKSFQGKGGGGSDESLVFSADGKTIFYLNGMLDLSTGNITPLERCSGFARAIDSNRTTLACVSADGVVLIDFKTGKVIGKPLIGPHTTILDLKFSSNNQMLAGSALDGTITLWDLNSHQAIGQPFKAETAVRGISFSPDNNYLVSGDDEDSVILWEVNPDLWRIRACATVGRNFTHEEWARYFPNENYGKTCEQWPLEPITTPTPLP